MNRGAARRRFNRNLAKARVNAERQAVWNKLADTGEPFSRSFTFDIEAGVFYCPYVPIMRTGSFIIGDTSA